MPGTCRSVMCAAAIVALVCLVPAAGWAQGAFPTKPVQIVAAFAPGGTSDLVARLLAPHLQKKWGQPVSVLNRAGGSGTPGTISVIQAPPDGYTVGIVATTNGILNDAIQSDLPYHWDSVGHIARIGVSALVFVVKKDSPLNSLKDLAEEIKRDPKKLKNASTAAAGGSTFAAAQLAEAIGVDATRIDRIPFAGGGPAGIAVAGGHADYMAGSVPEVIELIRGGQLKALAVTTPQRVKELPGVPTTKEMGYETVNQMGIYGLGGPPKLPDAILKKWEDTIAELMRDPQFVADLEKIGADPAYQNAREFRDFVEKEYKTARNLAEKLKLRK